MPSPVELIAADYQHRGLSWSPPNGRKLIVKPADRSNYSMPEDDRYRGTRQHLGAVIHTPEEPADDNEVTPRWFDNPKANASTDAYADSDGDWYALVPSIATAWAQGQPASRNRWLVEKRAYPDWYPKGNDGRPLSFNQVFDSVEVEGYAATMEKTFIQGGNQWDSVCSWIGWRMWVFEWEGLDRLFSHRELDTWKTDPGAYVISLFPAIYEEAVTYRDSFEQDAQDLAKPHPADTTPDHDDAHAALETRIENVDAKIAALDSWIKSYRSG